MTKFLAFVDEFLINQPEKAFGSSTKFIASVSSNSKQNMALKELTRDDLLEEAKNLATCAYESNTEWGNKASISYAIYTCLKITLTV